MKPTRNVRTRRRIISLVYIGTANGFCAVLAAYFIAQTPPDTVSIVLCVGGGIGNLILFNWDRLRNALHKVFCGDAMACQYCQGEIKFVQSWSCSCGFASYRHVFSSCPSCLREGRKAHIDYLNCKVCGHSNNL